MSLASILLFAATFTRALIGVDSLDPVKAQTTYDCHAVQLLYETPLEIDYEARPYKIKSGACELLELSEDGLIYSFKMTSSTPLNAYDVKRSIDRLRDSKNPSPGSWTMKCVSDVIVTSERTFKIKLKTRQHVFPWMLTMAYCAIQGKNGEFTGPYRLKSWWRNYEIIFERNPNWHGWKLYDDGGVNAFNEVRYIVVNDVTTQWLMFLNGEIDFLGEIARDNWGAVMDEDGRLYSSLKKRGIKLCGGAPANEIRYIGMNMNDAILGKNKKLRQALSCAFDFQRWKLFYNNSICKTDGPVPPTVEGCLKTPFEYSYNLEKAKKLLKEAGYPDGIDPKTGRSLVISLAIGRPTQDSREAGELLASFYAEIGVKIELKFQTWHAFLNSINKGNYQLYMMAWIADYPDPENFLQLFYSKNKSPGPNRSCYNNPEYDLEYDKAMSALNKKERIKHWYRCQEILREDCPWIYTHITKNYTLVNSRVGNYMATDFPYGHEKHYRNLKK